MYHINAHITNRLDWEDTNEIDWKSPGCWPADYIPYDNLRPNKSKGLASWNYKGGKPGFLNIIGTDGGIINLGSEYTNLLIYDSDPEFNDISYLADGAIVRATTRTKTRASHTANKFANKDEECKKDRLHWQEANVAANILLTGNKEQKELGRVRLMYNSLADTTIPYKKVYAEKLSDNEMEK